MVGKGLFDWLTTVKFDDFPRASATSKDLSCMLSEVRVPSPILVKTSCKLRCNDLKVKLRFSVPSARIAEIVIIEKFLSHVFYGCNSLAAALSFKPILQAYSAKKRLLYFVFQFE